MYDAAIAEQVTRLCVRHRLTTVRISEDGNFSGFSELTSRKCTRRCRCGGGGGVFLILNSFFLVKKPPQKYSSNKFHIITSKN